MKKTTLSIIILSTAPLYLLAQYGGGNGNGETIKPLTTSQLNGNVVSIYGGGNGRGETDSIINTSQLSGETIGLYGGGIGRGESDSTQNNNQLNGTMTTIFGGGNGRGEINFIINNTQINGDTVDIYDGGNGRGETANILTTNQLNGDSVSIYGGGNGRGETNFTQNTLQLDGLIASIYMGGDGRGETVKVVSNIPLPITLMSFGASLIGKEVKVQWQTATEINSAFFVVEKSVDGTNWQPIGQVKAAGNSNSLLDYSLFDTNPVEGANFYRLKPTDINGKFTYSSIAIVNYHLAGLATQISVFPNPAKYQFTLQISGLASVAKLNVKLVSVAGQTVMQKQNLIGNSQVFDISMLAKGTYFLMIDNNGTVSVAKIIKE